MDNEHLKLKVVSQGCGLCFWDHADLGIWIHGCGVDEDYRDHEALLDWLSLQKREKAGEEMRNGETPWRDW